MLKPVRVTNGGRYDRHATSFSSMGSTQSHGRYATEGANQRRVSGTPPSGRTPFSETEQRTKGRMWFNRCCAKSAAPSIPCFIACSACFWVISSSRRRSSSFISSRSSGRRSPRRDRQNPRHPVIQHDRVGFLDTLVPRKTGSLKVALARIIGVDEIARELVGQVINSNSKRGPERLCRGPSVLFLPSNRPQSSFTDAPNKPKFLFRRLRPDTLDSTISKTSHVKSMSEAGKARRSVNPYLFRTLKITAMRPHFKTAARRCSIRKMNLPRSEAETDTRLAKDRD